MSKPDLYADLGVPKSATAAEIKTAHRKRVKAVHPDKHNGNAAKADEFRRVQHAFEVLSDPVRRLNYDQTGDDKSAAPYDVQPEALLAGIWEGILQEFGPDDDLVEIARGSLRKGLADFRAELKAHKVFKQRWEKMRARLRKKTEAADILGAMIDAKIEMEAAACARSQRNIVLGEAALKLLDEYSYEVPARSGKGRGHGDALTDLLTSMSERPCRRNPFTTYYGA